MNYWQILNGFELDRVVRLMKLYVWLTTPKISRYNNIGESGDQNMSKYFNKTALRTVLCDAKVNDGR